MRFSCALPEPIPDQWYHESTPGFRDCPAPPPSACPMGPTDHRLQGNHNGLARSPIGLPDGKPRSADAQTFSPAAPRAVAQMKTAVLSFPSGKPMGEPDAQVPALSPIILRRLGGQGSRRAALRS